MDWPFSILSSWYNHTSAKTTHRIGLDGHAANRQPNGEVWQIDAGAAGNGAVETFVDVVLSVGQVRYDVYNNAGGTWSLMESWTEQANVIPEPTTLTLLAMGSLAALKRRRR